MARALVVALWCAAATAAASGRYEDYSGARMPQYASADYDAPEAARAHEPDDYRARSPDAPDPPAAPAAPDYKYEEELADALGKKEQPSISKEKNQFEVTDSWHRLGRKRKRKTTRADSEERHTADEPASFNPEVDLPRAKSASRFKKHRPRLKSRNYESTNEEIHRYSHRDDDMQENDDVWLKESYGNGEKNYMDDNSRYSRKLARRKPRDKPNRVLSNTEKDDQEKSDPDMERWIRMRSGLGRAPMPDPFSDMEDERATHQRPESPAKKPPTLESDRERPLQSLEEEDDISVIAKTTKRKENKLNNYEEYNDFYDMKRVMNIKNKLPLLMRRPTVEEEISTNEPVPAFRPAVEPATDSGLSRSLEQLLSNRLTESQWTTASNIAERELTALLGARRQRKEAHEPASSAEPLPRSTPLSLSLSPQAVDPHLDHAWQAFIATNHASSHLYISVYLSYLAILINYLEI